MGCPAALGCPDPEQLRLELWGRARTSGEWIYLYSLCRPAAAPEEAAPTITPAMVLTEIRRIGLPQLSVQIQPAGKTLVNLDTIFYAEPAPFTASLTLLGRPVQVQATPSGYTWHHGDGTTQTSTTPGAPYPAQEVTHAYARTGEVTARVDVTYTARFRVNGGTWRDIPDTVTITGPPSDLRIAEATPVLSGDH